MPEDHPPPPPPFTVPDLEPVAPLTGPSPSPPYAWVAGTEDAACRYRLREVYDESLGDELVAAHQLLVTYDVSAKNEPDGGVAYTVKVGHIRTIARREDYVAKLDSDRSRDLRRVHGGADTMVLFDIVVPFALLERPLSVTIAGDGALRAVEGGDAVRAAMLAMSPPKPRADPAHRQRIDALVSDARLAEYVLPMVGLTPAKAPTSKARDDADYAVRELRNVRTRAQGPAVLWELKSVFAPEKDSPKDASVVLERGQTQVTVEQQPGRACFRQAGSRHERAERWTGVIEDVEVTRTRTKTRTRLWIRSEPGTP